MNKENKKSSVDTK